jgi:hypothetical protein
MRFLSLLLLLSCAGATTAADWKEVPMAQSDQQWRWCSEHLDGPEKADRGFCWISKECKKKFLAKDECRNKPYFCAFTDIECFKRNDFPNKKLIQTEAIMLLK